MAINIDPSQSIDSILQGLKFTAQMELVVINKTDSPLARVGAYNDNENWPLGDIQPNTAEQVRLPSDAFSFAANYQIAGGKNFQCAASSPFIGRKKLNLRRAMQRVMIPHVKHGTKWKMPVIKMLPMLPTLLQLDFSKSGLHRCGFLR